MNDMIPVTTDKDSASHQGVRLEGRSTQFALLLAIECVLLSACGDSADGNATLGGDPKSVADEAESNPRRNGPFGIAAGMPLSELATEGDREAATGLSILSSAPDPNSEFPGIAVISFPETGVCEIRALSRIFDSDSYIVSASAFADQTAAALDTRYGKSKKNQGCSGYSCDSPYKLMHIKDGSYWYGYEWRPAGSGSLPSQVKAIDLYILNAQFNDSQVRLDYRFNNQDACENAGKAAKAGNL